jgi:NAD/NADP transhydrogenase beta subunit
MLACHQKNSLVLNGLNASSGWSAAALKQSLHDGLLMLLRGALVLQITLVLTSVMLSETT